MKIVHVTAGPLSAGAGRSVLDLHLGLRSRGVDSKIITNDREYESHPSIIYVNKNTGSISGYIRHLISRLYNIYFIKND